MTTAIQKKPVDVGALRSSPIHGIKPVSDVPQLLSIDAVEKDPTNPGVVTDSLRYERREPSISDSYDIIGRIVYPIVVCQHPDDQKRARGIVINIDGHGRWDQAKRRKEAQIWAIVYPPLNLEQRICLRQTLGAAQEPFDAVSVMKDLEYLAKERGLDVSVAADVDVLLRDLPEKVRKYRVDLLMLTRWVGSAVLGESYKKESEVIGLDKVRGMTRILDALVDHHPALYEELGGDKGITKRLAKMYVEKKFSTGSRSQEAVRKVASAVRVLEDGNPLVKRFFSEELDHAVLAPFAKTRAAAAKDIVGLCQEMVSLLVIASSEDLDEGERRALSALNTMITGLLK